MKIFVTGAGGYIGGSVSMQLLATGHRVRGLTRGGASAERLARSGIEPVLGTLDDAAVLKREASASEGVINAASSDHAGAVDALMAGLEGSSKPLLHTSGSSVVGDDARGSRSSDNIFDEDTPLLVNPLRQARRELDLTVLAAARRGIRSAVLCPSLIYGVGRGLNPHSVQIPFLVANAREQGVVQVVGAGLNTWANVHIEDVASLYLLALAKAPAGSFYFVENGEASFGEIGQAIARRLGLAGVENLPAELAAQKWGESKAYATLGSNSRVRASRARRELGWTPAYASVTDWILTQMPVDDAPSAASVPSIPKS